MTSRGGVKTLVRLLTIREVAQQLGVSIATVERLVAAHELPVVRIARKRSLVRVSSAVLEQCIESWSEEFA